MEITLEKIELVKDRTGVSYKEAKEALEAADGSVVDAIIAIEETVDDKGGKKAGEAANETVEKIKELVKKGNISKISIKKDEETILNLPLNAGLIGALVAPWGVIAGVIAAFGFKCKIELTKDDGTVIDISQRAEAIGKEVKEKGSVVVDDVVAKGSAVASDVMEKGTEAYYNIKDAAADKISEIKGRREDLDDMAEDIADGIADIAEELGDKLEDLADDVKEAVQECFEKPEEAQDADEEPKA